MLGLGDFWVAAGLILSILSMFLCIGYGIIYWNKDGETPGRASGKKAWEQEEQ